MFSLAEILPPLFPELVLAVGVLVLLLYSSIHNRPTKNSGKYAAGGGVAYAAGGATWQQDESPYGNPYATSRPTTYATSRPHPYTAATTNLTFAASVRRHLFGFHDSLHRHSNTSRLLVYLILICAILALGYKGVVGRGIGITNTGAKVNIATGIGNFFALAGSYDFKEVSFAGAFVVDNFIMISKAIIFLWAFLFFFVLKPTTTKTMEAEKYICFLFTVLGYALAISSNDLILLFLGLEMSSIALTFFMVLDGNNRAIVSNIFFAHCIGASLFLFGCAILFGLFNTTSYPLLLNKIANIYIPGHEINTIASAVGNGPAPKCFSLSLAVAFLFLGISAKMLCIPFHGIFKDTSEKLNWRAFILINFLPIFACTMILIRFFSFFCLEDYKLFFFFSGLVTTILGFLNAVNQNTLKGMLACNSLGNIGILFMCFSAVNINIILSLFYFFIIQSLALMVCAGIISSLELSERRFKTINDLSFIGERVSAFFAFLLGTSILCFTGFPPFPSFITLILLLKVLILEEAYITVAVIVAMKVVSVLGGIRMVTPLLSSATRNLGMAFGGHSEHAENTVAACSHRRGIRDDNGWTGAAGEGLEGGATGPAPQAGAHQAGAVGHAGAGPAHQAGAHQAGAVGHAGAGPAHQAGAAGHATTEARKSTGINNQRKFWPGLRRSAQNRNDGHGNAANNAWKPSRLNVMTASRICFAGILLAALSIKMAEVCQIFTPAEVSLRLYKIAARADE